MCHFCVKHGDGERWYRNAASYAADLESDLARRGYMVGFVRDFEQHRVSIEAGFKVLRYAPVPLARAAKGAASLALQKAHFGQPVPLEECERIFALATNITRLPCVCRGALQPGSDAESCCIMATVRPHDDVLGEAFRDYSPGPHAEGFQKLTAAEAVAYLRKAEARGLAHTAWTFQTPFIAAICNCDLPSGCMAMRLQLRGGVRIMWKGEDVIRMDPEVCNACGNCVPSCPFDALRNPRKGEVRLDRQRCWGCGTCRTACARGALTLEPRAGAPDVAASW